jgi:hypothetical protein
MNDQLALWPAEKVIAAADVLNWAEFVGMGKTTAYKWVKQSIDDGRLEPLGHGTYKKVVPS